MRLGDNFVNYTRAERGALGNVMSMKANHRYLKNSWENGKKKVAGSSLASEYLHVFYGKETF